MTAGTRTYGLHETLIEPRVLPPPPTRHALLVFLITLASILHLGTAGWSDIHNGEEGLYASAARQTIASSSGSKPVFDRPPLMRWLMAGSFEIFGVKAATARFPLALATVASIALTFLIGERLGGYWRGFVAGLIQLCCLGSFIWGRIVTPGPLFAALLEATIFCAICGYQRKQRRRLWFAGVWICSAFACMASGVIGFVYPALIFLLLAALFREGRMRFVALLHWVNPLIFLALLTPLIVLNDFRWRVSAGGDGIPIDKFLCLQALCWFPALLLVLPGALFAARKVFRPHDRDLGDALPICWMAIGFVPILFSPHRQDYDMLPLWSAFALWSACAWERMPRPSRLAGICLVAIAGIALACSAALNLSASLPAPLVVGWRMIFVLIGISVVTCAAVAAYFSWRDRETLAIAIILLGMVPVGLTAAEGMARMGSHLSLANAAQFLRPRLGEQGEVLYEGSAFAGSSLSFYLDKPFIVVDESEQSRQTAMEKLTESHPVYLVIQKNRVPYWQERLTERFHIYHQETTCGAHVVVSNLP